MEEGTEEENKTIEHEDTSIGYLGYTFAKPKIPPGATKPIETKEPPKIPHSYCTTGIPNTIAEELKGLVGPAKGLSKGPRSFLEKHREELEDLLAFRVIRNCEHTEDQYLWWLADLRTIFSTQLPNMPKEYIVRLVFDWRHRSLLSLKHGYVIGGITLRPFPPQGFLEITFCAVTSAEQMSGYGSHLMNHLKAYAQTQKLYYFLTYADNNAIGYFKKQGFTLEITLDKKRWGGYIKDYQGGTLMECVLHPKINYLDRELVTRQRDIVYDKIMEITQSQKRYSGIQWKKNQKRIRIADIPGIGESTWSICSTVKPPPKSVTLLKDELSVILKKVQTMEASWPFREPVDANEVIDYYKVIKDPIDLQTIEERLESGEYYITRDIFFADLKRMCNNCRLYNPEDSIYYRCANSIEDKVREMFYNESGMPLMGDIPSIFS